MDQTNEGAKQAASVFPRLLLIEALSALTPLHRPLPQSGRRSISGKNGRRAKAQCEKQTHEEAMEFHSGSMDRDGRRGENILQGAPRDAARGTCSFHASARRVCKSAWI